MLRTRLIAGPTAGFVLSAVFAVLMTLAGVSEVLVEPLRVDPAVPAPVSLRLPPNILPEVSGGDGFQAPPRTIGRGEVAGDEELARAVRAYESGRRPPSLGHVLGAFVLYFLLAWMLTTYLRAFSPSRGALLRTQTGLLSLTFVLLLFAKVFLLLTPYSVLCIPVAALPLWCALYLDRRAATMVSIAVAFLAASFVHFRLTVVTVFLAATLTATVAFRDRKRKKTILVAGAFSSLSSVAVLLAAKMLFEGGVDLTDELMDPLRSDLVAAAAGGVSAGLVAWALSGFAVLTLGAVSRSRLQDLTDLDQPLLQKMKKEAPGSWEHSRAMANLAESAASAIGADTLLIRVGAYYHDLGKTCQCKYFVENLEPGEVSPHVGLDPDVSADAIMAHVVEGTRILREGRIPEPVIEFCYTHHGTSVIEYFWHKSIEQGNPKKLEESFFRYPGMRPRTKETAILMLIDSIEAASRTVDPPTREKFEEMVQRIFFVKLRQGQLDESGLTIEDIHKLTANITDTLCSAFHNRIKYPWQDRKEQGQGQLPMAGVATEEDVARARQKAADEEESARA